MTETGYEVPVERAHRNIADVVRVLTNALREIEDLDEDCACAAIARNALSEAAIAANRRP
jgi:hypothetical protein